MSVFVHHAVWVAVPDAPAFRAYRGPSARTAQRFAAALRTRIQAEPAIPEAAVTVIIRQDPGLHPLRLCEALLLLIVSMALIVPTGLRLVLMVLALVALKCAASLLDRWHDADPQRF